MAKCMCCGEEIVNGVHTNMEDFISCPNCFETAMNNMYGEGNWWFVDDDGADGFYMAIDDKTGKEFGTGIYYTEIEGPDDDFLVWFEDK